MNEVAAAFSTMMYMLFAKFMLNDVPHAAGLTNPHRKLTRVEFESLPLAYHGYDAPYEEVDVLHVTPNVEIAKSHGRYLMTGRVLPEKLIADPEMEGFADRRLSGIESFNLGSARVPKKYYWPDNYELYIEDERPTDAQIRYISILCMRKGVKEPLEGQVKTQGEAGRLIRSLGG